MLTKFVVVFLITVVFHLSESVKDTIFGTKWTLETLFILCAINTVGNFHVGCELVLATIDLLTFLALKCVLLQSIAI